MYHAKEYRIGKNKIARNRETKTVAPTVRRVRRLDATPEGCRRNKERQTKIRTGSHAADGFLNCSFLPKMEEKQTVQACLQTAATEGDFYQSLSRLAGYYGIQPMQTKQYGYPYNIALALNDAEKQLKNKVRDWEAIRLIREGNTVFLESEERYDTGNTLYYIPVMPLYRMLQSPECKHAALLLLSVCSYLYHVAHIPYYREKNNYLHWQYEMLEEWILQDDDGQERNDFLYELKQAKQVGDCMHKKILNHANIDRFADRLERFKSKNVFDHDCWVLASEIFQLYQTYPEGNIFNNIRTEENIEEKEEEDTASIDRYISFIADSTGLLFQSIFDNVNMELQEYRQQEEPAIIRRFNGSRIADNNLAFENRIFPLMEELIFILNSH